MSVDTQLLMLSTSSKIQCKEVIIKKTIGKNNTGDNVIGNNITGKNIIVIQGYYRWSIIGKNTIGKTIG